MALQKFFKPKYFYSLKRIGGANDGGYLVGINSLEKADYLVSIGINDDWSFEESIRKLRKNIEIFCYDDNLSLKFILRNLIIQIIFVIFNLNFTLVIKKLWIVINYFFFKSKVHYFKQKITNKNINNVFFGKKNILLKIDIEGCEYRILDQIIKIQNKLIGLIIEFHDVDLHYKVIKNFMKKLNLKLIHIHGNNYSEMDNFGNPTMIELTFEKNPVVSKKKSKIPHPLDQPNNNKKKEVILNFS